MYLWKPPSFDEPLPPLPDALELPERLSSAGTVNRLTASSVDTSGQDLQSIRAKAHQEAFLRGLQEGLAEGRLQGEAIGREEGWKSGVEEGRSQGFAQGLQESHERLSSLTNSLESALSELTGLPQQLGPALTEWVYETSRRLAGQQTMAREPFVSAVQEALMRLPRPGETLFLRISSSDLGVWQQLFEQLPAGMVVTLLEDPHLESGHAYLEVSGARVDIGHAARDALVRSALGLMPISVESSEG